MDNTAATLLGAVIGAVVAGIWSDLANREIHNDANTVLLTNDWESTEMYQARTNADNYLHPFFFDKNNKPKASNELDIDALWTDIKTRYTSGGEPAKPIYALFRLIHFFERISILYKQGQLNNNFAIEFFGSNYSWWYFNYLESIKKPAEQYLNMKLRHGWLLTHEDKASFDAAETKRQNPTL